MMAFGPSAKRRYPTPLTTHQRWMVSLDAVLAERTWDRSHLMLYPLKRINPSNCQTSLKQSWDVTSPQSLQSRLHWLATEGHRVQMTPLLGRPPLAWDYGRYVTVVRLGFGAGYVDERGAWHLSPARRRRWRRPTARGRPSQRTSSPGANWGCAAPAANGQGRRTTPCRPYVDCWIRRTRPVHGCRCHGRPSTKPTRYPLGDRRGGAQHSTARRAVGRPR